MTIKEKLESVHAKRGTVMRTMCEDDLVAIYAADGSCIGFVRLVHSPNNGKVKLAFSFDRSIGVRQGGWIDEAPRDALANR